MNARSNGKWLVWCYAATILVSAFLVFQIQPIISKTILPWFGGSPAVWTTCMSFFQLVLFGGYAYAYLLTRLEPTWQGKLHFLLVTATLFFLPITPHPSWKPTGAEDPTLRILGLLLFTVGLPYFLLASTGPLIQAWFCRTCEGHSPYRLYALSNVGSLAALLTYPFLVEPMMTTNEQGKFWSVGFCMFTLFCGCCAMKIWRLRTLRNETNPTKDNELDTSPSWLIHLTWLLLPAFASLMLLATTNHVCQDVAVIPFLWVIPLGLYLLTFIFAFDSDRWYSSRWYSLAVLSIIVLLSTASVTGYVFHIVLEIAISFSAMFFVCMLCHGELAARKPNPRYLTQFYLLSSGGGAVGGIIVTVMCPAIFANYFEMNLALLVAYVLALVVFFQVKPSIELHSLPVWKRIAGICCFICLLVVIRGQLSCATLGKMASSRNFYGILSIIESHSSDPKQCGRALVHGRIVHGFQYSLPDRKHLTTKYYTRNSGIGQTMLRYPRNGPLRVGVIGLGVGTVAAYGQDGDYFRFYEINPDVVEMAQDYFTFLKDSAATWDVILGDARLMMEREEDQYFDILVLDAFSGDAIPMHLLTLEAFAIYTRHLKPDGVLVANISNRHVNLSGVFTQLANFYDLRTSEFLTEGTDAPGTSGSHSLTATRNQEFLNDPVVHGKRTDLDPQYAQLPMWTDEYSNLLWILK